MERDTLTKLYAYAETYQQKTEGTSAPVTKDVRSRLIVIGDTALEVIQMPAEQKEPRSYTEQEIEKMLLEKRAVLYDTQRRPIETYKGIKVPTVQQILENIARGTNTQANV